MQDYEVVAIEKELEVSVEELLLGLSEGMKWMNSRQAVDKFGEVVMTDLRDKTIDFFELLVEGK